MKGGNRTGLTVRFVETVKAPGFYADGGTLYLEVRPGGARYWTQRVTIKGKQTDIGLGSYPVVTLAMARDLALDNRRMVRAGVHPLAEKRRASMPTFREAAEQFRDSRRMVWRGNATAKKWDAVLGKHAYPVFGDTPVDSVTRADVLRALSPIWESTHAVARDLSQYIDQTLTWCEASGYIDAHPLPRRVLKMLLVEKPTTDKDGYRHLPYAEVPEAMRMIAEYGGRATSCMFRFMVLTGVRPGEARAATWAEVDRGAGVWTVPGARMKEGKEHAVPLSDAAGAVLDEAAAISDGSDVVFPSASRPGHPVSDGTVTKMLKTLGIHSRAVAHGFRKSFRTWMEERTTADFAVKEMALSHAVGNQVERIYQRSDLLAKRRVLMGQWADFLTGKRATVARIGERTGT